jgi:hypothetical protein
MYFFSSTSALRKEHLNYFALLFRQQTLLISRDNVALSLHNTAQQGNLVLDEYLATVCRLKDGKIAAIETFLSNVDGMNAFFV